MQGGDVLRMNWMNVLWCEREHAKLQKWNARMRMLLLLLLRWCYYCIILLILLDYYAAVLYGCQKWVVII